MTTVAGVVAYNPDATRLRENLAALCTQVDAVILVDNASEDHESILAVISALDEPSKVHVQQNATNTGMARALNQIMRTAADWTCDWVLLLDQDSVCSANMVEELQFHATNGVGIAAPSIVDRNVETSFDVQSKVVDIDYCITSGSLCHIATWREVGGYDENMFIDFVDFDYCLRVRMRGLRIVRVTGPLLLHQIGDSRRHGRRIAYNHSAFRSYHMARDMLYYARKHRRSPQSLKVHRRGIGAMYLILLRKALTVALHESDRWPRVTALLRGMIDETLGLRDRGVGGRRGNARRARPQ